MESVFEGLHVDISGPDNGDPVLVLHGWGSSAELMLPVANALNDRYRVFNIDLPGHGKTPPPPEPWGVPEYAALVRYFVDKNGLGPLPLVGHSNGGRIGLFLAANQTESRILTRMALISPSGIKRTNRSFSYYFRKYTAKILKLPFTWLPSFWRNPGLHWLRNTPLWRALGSSDYQSLTGVMRDTFVKTVQYHLDDQLHLIRVPTLVLWGEKDDAVSRAQVDKLVAGVKDAGLVTVPDAGHFGYLSNPRAFLPVIRHFIDADDLLNAEPGQSAVVAQPGNEGVESP